VNTNSLDFGGAHGGGNGGEPRLPWKRALASPLARAGFVLGMGFGGLADGIVLHQILGWHHLVCYTADCRPSSIEELQLEGTQDGYFHLGLWLVLLVGTVMLFRARLQAGEMRSGRTLAGAMLLGCGVFNVAEGTVNHEILGIHHVLPGHGHQLLFDMLYLANGALLALAGTWLACSRAKRR
jgi:uncharacterized membrane protein